MNNLLKKKNYHKKKERNVPLNCGLKSFCCNWTLVLFPYIHKEFTIIKH